MKEKIFKKGITRRLFSVVLALAMVIALLPINATRTLAAGGATDEFSSFNWRTKTYTGNYYKIVCDECDSSGPIVVYRTNQNENKKFVISSLNSGTEIEEVKLTVAWLGDGWDQITWGDLTLSSGTISNSSDNISNGATVTISNVNATTLTVSAPQGDALAKVDNQGAIQFKPIIVSDTPTGGSTHTHGSWDYTADGATLTAECKADGDCTLDNKKVSLTLTASSANYSGSAATITIGTETEKTAWTGAGLTVPAISYEKANGEEALDTAPTTPGSYKAKVTAGEGSGAVTAEVPFTIYANSYTLTVPADLTITQPGWNALDSVNVSGNISPDKQIKVTAASANEFKLKSGENTVSYTLKKSEADPEELGTVTFSSAAVNAENGASQTVGINVDDYSNKPEGNYEDTITWTATMENVSTQS